MNSHYRKLRRVAPSRQYGFTLIEMLVVMGILSVLMALTTGAVMRARSMSRDVVCRSNLRQLGIAVQMYTGDYSGFYPPLGWWQSYPVNYWWGTNENPPNYSRGALAAYLGKAGQDGDVYQCPDQPWGSYTPEGEGQAPTTTYGYNGYYLSSPAVPGWSHSMMGMLWQNVDTIENPSQVIMFADTLLDWGDGKVTNTSFLDPPFTFSRGRWRQNHATTLCFRHNGRANICFADGRVDSVHHSAGTIVSQGSMTGYIGQSNAPHYVPDYQEW